MDCNRRLLRLHVYSRTIVNRMAYTESSQNTEKSTRERRNAVTKCNSHLVCFTILTKFKNNFFMQVFLKSYDRGSKEKTRH